MSRSGEWGENARKNIMTVLYVRYDQPVPTALHTVRLLEAKASLAKVVPYGTVYTPST
jgi:hypothetical protein